MSIASYRRPRDSKPREIPMAGRRAALADVLARNGGVVSRAARALGQPRQAFDNAMHRTGLSVRSHVTDS